MRAIQCCMNAMFALALAASGAACRHACQESPSLTICPPCRDIVPPAVAEQSAHETEKSAIDFLDRTLASPAAEADRTFASSDTASSTSAAEKLGDDQSNGESVAAAGAPAVSVSEAPSVAREAIDLASALELAAGRNPQVGFAQERIREAYAQRQAAGLLWVPSLRAGANYNKHEGRIQDVVGHIIETSRGSVYGGLGASAVGAGSPAVPGLLVNVPLRDAIFQPRIANRALAARRQAREATLNDTLLSVSVAYLNLLEAVQLAAVARETLENARNLAALTRSFADSGQGLQADADRAQAELSVREVEARRAEENIKVASVRIARLLSRDPSQAFEPQESVLAPIDVVASDASINELVSIGLANRPELAESQSLVSEAVERLRRERYAPLIPSVLLGLSYGGNAGGLGGDIINFGDRLDLDASAWWELRNLGLGEKAARNQAQARLNQAHWQQVQVMDQVAADVAESHAQTVSSKDQIELSQSGITAARDSYRRNSERIRDGQGLPIETLQSLQALDAAQRQYVRAVADYNRAQFRLHRALGWPES